MVWPTSRRARALAALIVTGLGADAAWGHAPPSEDLNDRYLKITPMGDRIRLAYTVVFGERPGQRMRPRLDRDRDGAIDDAEAAPLGSQLSAQVTAAWTVSLDGAPVPLAWARVEVGLGTPTVAAGALSVDLIGWVCTEPGAHRLAIRDDLVLDQMGATELTVEASPGITVESRTLGGAAMEQDVASWTGRGGPLATGFDLRYRASADAPRPHDRRCQAPRRTSGPRRALIFVGTTVIAAALGAVVMWLRVRADGRARTRSS